MIKIALLPRMIGFSPVCGNLIIAVCWYGEVDGDYV